MSDSPAEETINVESQTSQTPGENKLFDLLVCPIGLAPLRRIGDSLECTSCGPKFRIVDGIPMMLVEAAEWPEGCSTCLLPHSGIPTGLGNG